ncbi:MAG: hypothetical protein K2K26_09800 [Muribaculaceae bacterium]|nr:hypothetical protein [Muribaculaceae bacterium]
MIYTYANDDLGYWGKGKTETIDVAMRINNPGLAGKKITSVKTLINATEGIINVSIWLTKELKLENKVNVPDIVSVSVTPVSTEYNGMEGVGVLTATFAEPYELTEEPVYVGYSLTVDVANDNNTKYPLWLSTAQNDEGLYLHMTRSVLKWKNYFPTLGAVAPIYVTLTGDFPEYAVSVSSINETYSEIGQPYNAVAVLSNVGTANIESLEYSYEVAGQTKQGAVSLDMPLTPDLVNPKNVDLVFDGIDELGDTEVTVTLNKVNGQNNTIISPVTFTTHVKPFVPVTRPLMEEYTGTWCGWCTRGWMALELIREWYPESVVSIAYHNGDPMEVTSSFAVAVSGFPGATINRGGVIDPYYGTGNGAYDFSVQYDLEDAMSVFAPGDINVSAMYSEDGNTIDVTGYSRFVENYDEMPYKVGYMLVADGLTDPSWRQNNSYAQYKNNPTYIGTYLETLCNWPASVSDLVFNDVAIDVSGMMGVDGSVPEAVESGVVYEHKYSYDISNNKLVRDGAELHVMAFLLDKKTGRVVNANKTAVTSYVGVGKTLGENVQPVSTVYYDLMGRRVEQPSNGLFIEVQKMSDGTQISHKVMKK